MSDFLAFEQAYGRAVPPALTVLYGDRELLASAPHRIALPGKPFVVEVQYYRRVTDLVAEDVALQRFAFAVNSDGHDMLVDLTERDLPVLQREFGEVDRLDFTLVEFLTAVTRPAVTSGRGANASQQRHAEPGAAPDTARHPGSPGL